jgi:hypothetical protein
MMTEAAKLGITRDMALLTDKLRNDVRAHIRAWKIWPDVDAADKILAGKDCIPFTELGPLTAQKGFQLTSIVRGKLSRVHMEAELIGKPVPAAQPVPQWQPIVPLPTNLFAAGSAASFYNPGRKADPITGPRARGRGAGKVRRS